jgi:hypothetical protein
MDAMTELTDDQAREVASHWHSPSVYDRNMTALSHGVADGWTPDGLLSEITRTIFEVRRSPQHYDNADECLGELRALRGWAIELTR